MDDSRTRILHVTHNMAVGGAEQVIRHLIAGVDKSKFDSSVVCIDGTIGTIGTELQSAGVSVESIDRGSGFDLQTIKKLRSLIKTGEYHVVHCHQYTPYCYGALATRFTDAKLIFTEHGRFFPDRFTWKRRIVNQVLYRFSDTIVAISEATKRALQEFEWIPERAVDVVYNGVESPIAVQEPDSIRDQLRIDHGVTILGSISRLDKIKNQQMMISALANILPQFPNTVLVLAGDGPERQELEACAKELGIADKLHFTGFVTDIGAYLQLIDIFLLTSFSEGTSMTLLEAMASSKPIVATSVGGNVELIEHEYSGLLVDSDDIDGLTEALKRLFLDASLQAKLGSQAKKTFEEKYTRQCMIDHYEAIYL